MTTCTHPKPFPQFNHTNRLISINVARLTDFGMFMGSEMGLRFIGFFEFEPTRDESSRVV